MLTRKRTVLAFAITAAACGGSPVTPTSTPAALVASASVTITGLEKFTAPIAPNMTIQLAAMLRSADGSTADCTATATWSSSDEKLLKLTGKAPGEFTIVDAGDSTASAVCASATGTVAVHVDRPTSWPVSGMVTSGLGGAGIGGATLTFGGHAPVTTGADGRYTIVTPDASSQRLLISAPGFQTRDTWLRGGTLRSLDIDLIPPDLLPIWQAMAHNGHEAPQSINNVPTQRWTGNPNIYIWTTWKDTGLPVNNVDWYVKEIRRVIPQLSGFTLQAGLIETGPTQRPPAAGWINLQFHHSGNYGYLGKNPGEVQLGSDHTCNYIAVTHEFGHAMGYWHTGKQNTIMGSTPGFCHEADLTTDELRVAKAMYSRALYNYAPDRESNTSATLSMRERDGVKVVCDHIR